MNFNDSLRVCHVVGGPLHEGAAKGAVLLHEALLRQGVRSRLLNDFVETDTTRPPGPFKRLARRIARRRRVKQERRQVKRYPERQNTLFSVGSPGIELSRHPVVRSSDVVHLHWINRGFVQLRDLKHLPQPVVWTLRDMWPLTGGCHYSIGCSRFQQQCGRCPQLGSDEDQDLSRQVHQLKGECYPENLSIVGISQWIADQARSSSLLKDRPIRTISNCIDLKNYYPVSRSEARKRLGLSPDRRYVLVGAVSPQSFYKGFQQMQQSLPMCNEPFELLIFGGMKRSTVLAPERATRSFGYISEASVLRDLYSAADVFLAPSIMEAFGKTIAESLACGTPVVAFDHSGPKELIEHERTGYLATPFKPESLAAGVDNLLRRQADQSIRPADLSERAQRYAPERAAEEYAALYRELLGSNANGGTQGGWRGRAA
ncbi:glycosyltransferase [Roseiconus nitratireducens]|uniref:Glycosyltransferase n=1 Tax=Roseiconus nitratireducens TaxID=2605748 RepID=A0A5M6CZP4_9BACT|nr:glycosyltransferase [Roseiconus nitratireducens]KAA5538759.1 glycosyltransferase [Roseiconus nitratireducens]